jgi:hypothetical protein
MTYANPSQEEYKTCVPFMEKHESHMTIKYTKWGIIEFTGVEQMKIVYSEL